MQPADRYRALVAEHKLTGDPEQEMVAAALDRLAHALADYEPGKRSFLGLGKKQAPPHIANVGNSFFEILIINLRKNFKVALNDFRESILSLNALFLDHSDDVFDHRAVFQN